MFLSRPSLLREIDSGNLIIDSDDRYEIGPGSIALHAGNAWYELERPVSGVFLDKQDSIPNSQKVAIDSNHYVEVPEQAVVFVYTKERISLSNRHFGMISGTSDLARLGIAVELSWYVAPGFGKNRPSSLLLEIHNTNKFAVNFPEGIRLGHLLIGEYQVEVDAGYETEVHRYDSIEDASPSSKIALRQALRIQNSD